MVNANRKRSARERAVINSSYKGKKGRKQSLEQFGRRLAAVSELGDKMSEVGSQADRLVSGIS